MHGTSGGIGLGQEWELLCVKAEAERRAQSRRKGVEAGGFLCRSMMGS